MIQSDGCRYDNSPSGSFITGPHALLHLETISCLRWSNREDNDQLDFCSAGVGFRNIHFFFRGRVFPCVPRQILLRFDRRSPLPIEKLLFKCLCMSSGPPMKNRELGPRVSQRRVIGFAQRQACQPCSLLQSMKRKQKALESLENCNRDVIIRTRIACKPVDFGN